MFFLGPSMVFTNVINPRSFINRKDQFRKTKVKKGSSIGANATIVCGVVIGEYSMIGSGAVVTKDTKPFGLYYGVPAKQEGWVSKSGNKLNFSNLGIAYDENEKYVLTEDKVRIVES